MQWMRSPNLSEKEYKLTRQHIEQKARNKIEVKQECKIRETQLIHIAIVY